MVVGYVLVGGFAGLIAALVALVLGTSFWTAFGLYVLVGSAVMMLLAAIQMAARAYSDRFSTLRHEEIGIVHLSEPSTSTQGSIAETSMSILAVDDDPFILELVPMISAKVGFSRVTPAASGEQALKLLNTTETTFDCLLFDINMPGMDGIELCRRVRQIPGYSETPIVMLTAMRDTKHLGEAFRAGATDYVTKPFDIEELGARLRLAQEAVHARKETFARTADMGHPRIPAPDYRFELPEGIRIGGVENLVDHTVLSNYLTQLPRKEATDVQVFAVSIDRIEAIHSRSSPEQFASLLENLAAAAVGCFGVNRTLMAYASNANLLVVACSASPMSAINLEIDLENRLKGNIADLGSDDGKANGVSVGGPVQLQGTKAERARTTTNRAIALAASRALDKRGRPIAGLFKQYPH